MGIKYAEIVGTRMAENGSGGYTVNSTSYSALIFYQDGNVELVEGDARAMRPYLRYMRPHCDASALEDLKLKLIQDMENLEARLKKDFDQVIEKNIGKVYNAAYPVPDITKKTYRYAKEELEKNGFIVEIKNPLHKPDESDIVDECCRKAETMRTVQLRLIPDLQGLTPQEIIQKLRISGFNVIDKPVRNGELPDSTIIQLEFKEDSDYDILLVRNDLSGNIPQDLESYFLTELEGLTSAAQIYERWNSYDLKSKFPNIEAYIKMKCDAESKQGSLPNIVQVREAISNLILQEKKS